MKVPRLSVMMRIEREQSSIWRPTGLHLPRQELSHRPPAWKLRAMVLTPDRRGSGPISHLSAVTLAHLSTLSFPACKVEITVTLHFLRGLLSSLNRLMPIKLSDQALGHRKSQHVLTTGVGDHSAHPGGRGWRGKGAPGLPPRAQAAGSPPCPSPGS